MSDIQTRLETLARRVQRIITTATGEDAPITQREAYTQVVEEMELAGFGAPTLGGDFTVQDVAELRRQSAH
jgi:hypothetical protein